MKPTADTLTALDFLSQFFATSTHDVELRALPSRRRILTRKPSEISRFLSKNSAENLYFGVATREGGGTKEHCRELIALYADIDGNAGNTIERIDGFTPKPSLLVSSGGGIHAYWLLDRPINARDPRVEALLKGVAAALGADAACAEIARVLRIPGTQNHKPKYGEPLRVTVIRADWNLRYGVDDFAAFALAPSNGHHMAAAPVAGQIPEGLRRTSLLSMAGSMRRRGAGVEEILAALLTMNERRCRPPLEEAEVRKLAEDVPSRYQPAAEVGANGPPSPASDPVTVVGPEGIKLPDMPDSVLDGLLGEICQRRMKDFPLAYSWPSLLTGAGTLVQPEKSELRANLDTGLVGPVHSGKSCAIERANYLLDVKPPILQELKAGSAEGLLAKIGNQQGLPALLFPDELAHLLEKAQITNASFAYILNSLFYKDQDTLTIAHGKPVNFNCRLSLIGGIVDVKFDDSFGSATTAGLYDRFLFGQCPTGFNFLWRPIEGAPAIVDQFDEPRINADVWEARDYIAKTENINPRLLEIALRCAFICAAVDGRELRARDLEPAWELARYQTRVRMLLQPNAGKNLEGCVAIKILNYLNRHAPDGQWMVARDVLKATRAYESGPSVVERALNAMKFGGAIEENIQTVGKGQKRRLIRHAGDCQ